MKFVFLIAMTLVTSNFAFAKGAKLVCKGENKSMVTVSFPDRNVTFKNGTNVEDGNVAITDLMDTFMGRPGAWKTSYLLKDGRVLVIASADGEKAGQLLNANGQKIVDYHRCK